MNYENNFFVGGFFMKIVVIKPPKVVAGFLRFIFGIKKVAE